MPMGFSFEVVDAEDYDALRPDYAPSAVAWVMERGGLDERSLVVDLAAGTGQLSRRFAPLGVRLVAVEPARNMRAVLRARLPGVRVRDGTAESMPLEDASADAVVVGNAFHHFDAERAFDEIRRVLRPAGSLALFWAHDREPRSSALRAIDGAVERARASSTTVAAYLRSFEVPGRVDGFTAFERRSFPTVHSIPSARLPDLYATSSDVASLPPPARSALLARIAELARDLPESLELAGRSDVDLCRRAADSGGP
jgi:SAM-dependent methyltransferase